MHKSAAASALVLLNSYASHPVTECSVRNLTTVLAVK